MSALSLTLGRREWTIELLLLLAESMLVWMSAAVLIAPFSSSSQPVSLSLVLGLTVLAGALPRMMHDRGIWGMRFSAVLVVAVVLSTVGAIKIVSFPEWPWQESGWMRDALRSLVFEDAGAVVLVWAPIALSAFCWWLPRLHGAPGVDRARSTLRVGAGVAAMAALAPSVTGAGPGDRAIGVAVAVFFGATLLALALARQGGTVRARRRLGSTVILPTIVIAMVAGLGALLVTTDWERKLPSGVPSLGVVLDPVFAVLMLLLTGIVFIVALPIMWLLSLGNYHPPQIVEFAGFEQGGESRAILAWHPPDPVRYALAILALIVIFYGVVRFGLAITRRDLERAETGLRSESSGRRRGGWLDRFRLRFGRDRIDPLADLRNDPVWAQTVRVRETYAAWLRWAQQHKRSRAVGETAREFHDRSGPLLRTPVSVAALDELTAIYDDVRYSQAPATKEQADRAVGAWHRLRSSEASASKP